MNFYSIEEMEYSLAVYYPSLDPAYPQAPRIEDLKMLALVFDKILIPGSHFSGLQNYPEIEDSVLSLLRNRKGICSVRKGQNSIEDFFRQKLNESGNFAPEVFRIYEKLSVNARGGFQRNTTNQSASFRTDLIERLTPQELDVLGPRLPSDPTHVLHRESLDDLLCQPEFASISQSVRAAEQSAYFTAGAHGNHTYLWDPSGVSSPSRLTEVPQLGVEAMKALMFRSGKGVKDFNRVPIEKIVALSENPGCRRMRQVLLLTIQRHLNDLDALAAEVHNKFENRQSRRKRTWRIVEAIMSALGYQSLAPLDLGVLGLLFGIGASNALMKLGEAMDRMVEPILSVKIDLERLIQEHP